MSHVACGDTLGAMISRAGDYGYGGSFFYGEVVITPAISVMSAIEGLEIVAPQLDTWIVPLSIIVLTLLFMIQKHGTGDGR